MIRTPFRPPAPPDRHTAAGIERYCTTCETYLPLDSFGVNRAMAGGRHRTCKRCTNASTAALRQRDAGLGLSRKAKQLPSRRNTLDRRERVLEAVRRGARTQVEIAFAADLITPRLRRALLRREGLKERLLTHADGIGLTVLEQTMLAEDLCLDQLGDDLNELLTDNLIFSKESCGQRIYFIRPDRMRLVVDPQRSLFEITSANSFGPRMRGASAHFRRADQREQPEGLEPPASRVA